MSSLMICFLTLFCCLEASDKKLSIVEVIGQGQFIVLSDDTTWQVKPSDITKVWSWLSKTDLKIETNKDPIYQNVLIDISSGEKIEIRKVNRNAIFPESNLLPPEKDLKEFEMPQENIDQEIQNKNDDQEMP